MDVLDLSIKASGSGMPTRAQKRRARTTTRAEAFRKKKNEEFQSKLLSYLDAKFALPPEAVLLENGEYFLPPSEEAPVSEDKVEVDFDSATAVMPVPVSTLSVQLLTDTFYDAMCSAVEGSNEVCSREQFTRTVHAKHLFNLEPVKFYGRFGFNSNCLSFLLPSSLEDVITATIFSLPVDVVPNKDLVCSTNLSSQIKTLVFKPTISDVSSQNVGILHKSRFLNIFDLMGTQPCHSMASKYEYASVSEQCLATDASATQRFLRLIPSDAHSTWKPKLFRTLGNDFSNNVYLLYDHVQWTTYRLGVNIFAPPPVTSRALLRLSSFGQPYDDQWLYGLYSDVEVDRQFFHARFRDIMRRNGVRKAFRNLGTVPLRADGAMHFRY